MRQPVIAKLSANTATTTTTTATTTTIVLLRLELQLKYYYYVLVRRKVGRGSLEPRLFFTTISISTTMSTTTDIGAVGFQKWSKTIFTDKASHA